MITCREASLVFKLAQYLAHGQTPSALPKADDDADDDQVSATLFTASNDGKACELGRLTSPY